MNLSRVVEALLFSAQKPLSIRELTTAIKGAGAEDELSPNEFARATEAEIAAALEQLKIEYVQEQHAFAMTEKAEGWQLVTDPAFVRWVRQLFPAPKPARLTAPALETLAIIAYRQPIIRADVEAVRGVSIDGVLQTLMERGLVKIAGRAEVPGRPLLYETTQSFSSLKSAKVGRFRRHLRRVRHSIPFTLANGLLSSRPVPITSANVVFRTIRALELVAVSFLIAISTTAFGQLRPADCARAAKYSESKRGISMLVI